MVSSRELKTEIARPAQVGLRSAWQWRPLASLTPAAVADLLRRASMGDAHDFLLAADDIREKDLHYRAVLQTRILSVVGLAPVLTAADDSLRAKRAHALVQTLLARIDLHGLVAHLMDAVAKGYAVAEILWDTTGGVWLPQAIVPREAHWFRFDADTGTQLRLVDGSVYGAEIAPYKMIVHTPPLASGIPLLGGLARSALWAWVFKSYALRDWARFAEMFGQPIRVGKYHQGASPEDVAVLKQAAFSLGSDAAAVIPAEMMLELVESGSKSASAELYHTLIEYLDSQVSKAVLGQTMTTDDGSSQAQAKVHNEVRSDIMRADVQAIVATLMRDLIAPVVRLNLGDDAPLPKLSLPVDEAEDMQALAVQVEKLAAAGVAIGQDWVRERFGIPAPKAGEAVIGGVDGGVRMNSHLHNPVGANACAQTTQARPAMYTFHATTPAPSHPMEGLAQGMSEAMVTQTEPGWHDLMADVRVMVERAKSLPELRDALLAAFGDLPTDKLTEVMALGFAAANLAGQFAVDAEARGG